MANYLSHHKIRFSVLLSFVFIVVGFELRAYTLSKPFLCGGFFFFCDKVLQIIFLG
jgi:hypothetical protein